MIYAMSDIHGCFEKYKTMLAKIDFTDKDTLYVLGDVVDWGDKPVEVLHDMSMRANVIPIMGNHEFYAYEMLHALFIKLGDGDLSKLTAIEADTLAWELEEWKKIGGRHTLEGFQRLAPDEREFLLDYIASFSLYENIAVKGVRYFLSHSGLPKGATPKNISSYDTYDFSMADIDYGRKYFNHIFLVTGHTPTYHIDKSCRGRIYRKNNHIAIDTGAVFGEAMGCICLDTGEEFYV